eukprot:IDg23682t1
MVASTASLPLRGKNTSPFRPNVHSTAANDLLQFDFLEIGPGADGLNYILMLRDDFSSYCWLFPFSGATASTADALLEWSTTFNTPKMFMSDQGTHFKYETIRRLSRSLKVPHHFTLPYTPWSNGQVERLGKEVLRALRVMVSELRLKFSEWPDIVPLVQSALNNLHPLSGLIRHLSLFLWAEILHPLLPLFGAVKQPILLPSPEADQRNCSTLKRSTSLSSMFYSDLDLNTTAIMPHVLASETGMPVQRLMNLVQSADGIEVVVRWRGLPNSADTTEPLQRIYEDVPQMLINLFNRKSTPRHLVDLAKSQLAL